MHSDDMPQWEADYYFNALTGHVPKTSQVHWAEQWGLAAPHEARVLAEEVLATRSIVFFSLLMFVFAVLAAPMGSAVAFGSLFLLTPIGYTLMVGRRARSTSRWLSYFWGSWAGSLALMVVFV